MSEVNQEVSPSSAPSSPRSLDTGANKDETDLVKPESESGDKKEEDSLPVKNDESPPVLTTAEVNNDEVKTQNEVKTEEEETNCVKQECDSGDKNEDDSSALNNNEELESISPAEELAEENKVKTEPETEEAPDTSISVDVQGDEDKKSDLQNCSDEKKEAQNHVNGESEPSEKVTDLYAEMKLPVNGHGAFRRRKRKPQDPYNIFGKFVAQELRLLESPEYRRLLKRKIQKAILEVSELDDKHARGSHE